MLRRSRGRTPRRGSTIVEAAIVMVLFLTFLFSIIEYGRYIALRQVCENSARRGARWCVANTNYNSNNGLSVGNKTKPIAVVNESTGNMERQLKNYAVDVFKINPVTGANLGNWDTSNSSDTIAVRISGDFTFVIPNYLQMASAVLNVNITVTMRAE
jgi:Flp pilus assembly protein TadG